MKKRTMDVKDVSLNGDTLSFTDESGFRYHLHVSMFGTVNLKDLEKIKTIEFRSNEENI